jgi:hypothetical protein
MENYRLYSGTLCPIQKITELKNSSYQSDELNEKINRKSSKNW